MKKLGEMFFVIALMAAPMAWAQGPLPVTPAQDQQSLLKSGDAKLAFNKRLIYDFWRIVLIGRRLEQAPRFMRVDYIQHNPNVDTGMQGFIEYVRKRGGPRAIPGEVPDLVSIQAEGDFVTFSFVNEMDEGGQKCTTTWFDMFRLQGGKIAEHWDCALLEEDAQ